MKNTIQINNLKMKPSKKQKAIIEDVNFQINLKGYSEQIVDSKQKNGLKESTIKSLLHFGFNIEIVPDFNFKIFKVTK